MWVYDDGESGILVICVGVCLINDGIVVLFD